HSLTTTYFANSTSLSLTLNSLKKNFLSPLDSLSLSLTHSLCTPKFKFKFHYFSLFRRFPPLNLPLNHSLLASNIEFLYLWLRYEAFSVSLIFYYYVKTVFREPNVGIVLRR
ncbi:hypothetical protein GIB67_000801, partial [Kingdonia uniflora]